MSITVLDNFDGEVEGTQPPANWTSSYAEVDDAQYVSSPHSMYNFNGSSWATAIRPSTAFGENLFTFYIRMDDVNNDVAFKVRDSSNNIIAGFYNTTTEITYYSGSAGVPSGYYWAADTWYKVEILLDDGAETYQMWWNDVLVTGGSVAYYTSAGLPDNLSLENRYGAGGVWADNFQYGEDEPMGFGVPYFRAGAGCGVTTNGVMPD